MRFLALLCCFGVFQVAVAQPNFEVVMRPVEFEGLPGLHSYAYAQSGEQVLIIGGRVEGLHKRVPGEAFAAEGKNKYLYVLNLQAKQIWYSDLTMLDIVLAAQLSSTNFEFHQEGDRLLLIGGYGIDPRTQEHVTWPTLIQIHVPALMSAIITNNVVNELFDRTDNPQFAVTGGQLRKLDSTYLLIGGHRFDGMYNPLNGPSFVQNYTNAVRRFRFVYNGTQNGAVQFLPEIRDSALLHRRDLNIVEQIRPDGSAYLTAFSGVFQQNHDYPYINAVHITSDAVVEQPQFAQYLNHYHCPTVPIFDSTAGQMHTFFFGGIAQYLWRRDTLIQDNEVPFTRAISCVTHARDGRMTEYQLPIKMPALLGAGAEFIPTQASPEGFSVILHSEIRNRKSEMAGSDTTWIGHILGGIESENASVFWYDDLSSKANTQLFEVGIVRNKKMALKENPFSTNGYQIHAFPDLDAQAVAVHFSTHKPTNVQASLYQKGIGLVAQTKLETKPVGKQVVFLKNGNTLTTGVYHLKLELNGVVWEQRILVTP
jgi:hypothetical protein